MPPKPRITKEQIEQAAVSLVRENGVAMLNARTLAHRLHCSTQPIFTNFASMEELRGVVLARAECLCGEYIRQEQERGLYPPYKASGMAYIRFAKEERELFKLLYMRDRSREDSAEGGEEPMTALVSQATGLQGEEAKLFHLEMWAFVHGIAVMHSTLFLELEEALIARMLTDCYQGLCQQYAKE